MNKFDMYLRAIESASEDEVDCQHESTEMTSNGTFCADCGKEL